MMEFGLAPVETLEKHHCIAREEGLKCAYIGNVPGHPLEHTYCPECKNIAIERYGFIMIILILCHMDFKGKVSYSKVTTISPVFIGWSLQVLISFTVPADGDFIWISIFIASTIAIV
jgi:hypothetical protein